MIKRSHSHTRSATSPIVAATFSRLNCYARTSVVLLILLSATAIFGSTPTLFGQSEMQTSLPAKTISTQLPGSTIPSMPTDVPTAVPVPEVAALSGRIRLEGRSSTPNEQWKTSLQVRLFAKQTEQVYAPVSSTEGIFVLDNLKPDAYVIAVQGRKTLQRIAKRTLSPGETEVDFGLLPTGDAVDDNRIDVQDFSLLAHGYGLCNGATDFIDMTDFNDDGCTDHNDFMLLQKNFGMIGDDANESDSVSKDPLRTLEPIEEPEIIASSKQGEQIMVSIRIDGTVPTQIDAGAIYLAFDPDQLRALSVTSNAFGVLLSNHIDNKIGRIDFAAGALDTVPQTPLTMVNILFEVVTDFDDSTLKLIQSDLRRTDIAYQGHSLYAGATENALSIEIHETVLAQEIFLPFIID